MKLNFMGNIDELKAGISILAKRLSYTCSTDGIPVEVEKTKGNIEITKKGNKATIKYQEKIHFFRALGLLVENLSHNDDFHIIETPKFKTNGIMADVSRNAVMTVQSIKEMLEIMAVMGLNMMMLYAEDTYEIENLPYFGYMRGRYTKEELKECDDHAYNLGIEMIPCIQTLAHLYHALKWSYASDIKDTHDILLAGDEKTYAFIEEMIKAASAPFKSKRIHIGMDEAHQLGLGQYLIEKGYHRRFDIMNQHLKKVQAITAKHGLSPMIWSDMYFRLGSKTGEYYDTQAVIPKDVIENIPKDIQLVYWDYYNNEKEYYNTFIKMHRQLGKDIVFAGGIWTWNGITINYDKTFITTNAALTACKEENVKEVFATLWGDDGAETNIFSALLGLQLYAEHGYSDEVHNEKLMKRFKFCTKGEGEAFMHISKLDRIPGVTGEVGITPSNPSRILLWQDILIGLFDRYVQGKGLSQYYRTLSQELKAYASQAGDLKFVFDVPAALADLLAEKSEIGMLLKQLYDEKDKAGLTEILNIRLPLLKDKAEKLRKTHREQWLKVYKPFGWEILDIRYGGLIARIDTAIYRLESYISGAIDKIEELEAERLNFYGEQELIPEKFPGCNQYHRIISASSI